MGSKVPAPIIDVTARGTVLVRDAFFRRALLIADIAAAVAAYVLATVVVGGGTPRGESVLALPLVVAFCKLAGLYDRDELRINKATSVDEMPTLFNIATLVALLTALTGGAIAEDKLAPAALLVLWLGLTSFLVLFRAAARAFALRGTPAERCLVVGDADASAQIGRKLADSPRMNSLVIGYVPLRDRIRGDDPRPLGRLEELGELITAGDVHRVIVAPRDTDSDDLLDIAREVKALGVKLSVLPRIFEVVGSSSQFDDLDGMTVLGVPRLGLTRSSRAMKRALDLVVAGAGLMVASPFLAATAIAIKLDSSGSVLFRQKRVGSDGDVFEILKFRTMVADAEARKEELRQDADSGGLFKMRDDPRITRVGRLLRRSSLDELPQLLNVLQGAMSLVGPRALVVDEDQRLAGWQRRRLQLLKPGMTGPWQILESGRITLYEMAKIDYLYVANWSMWNDVKLLIRTVPYMLARRGM
ncbi:MAG TPA: sugar transferase [Solirubrobacteraceae bacterium]|jgi:exopolysaccharide biosynthesis polyprenyl glycosylphosphotransferase